MFVIHPTLDCRYWFHDLCLESREGLLSLIFIIFSLIIDQWSFSSSSSSSSSSVRWILGIIWHCNVCADAGDVGSVESSQGCGSVLAVQGRGHTARVQRVDETNTGSCGWQWLSDALVLFWRKSRQVRRRRTGHGDRLAQTNRYRGFSTSTHTLELIASNEISTEWPIKTAQLRRS